MADKMKETVHGIVQVRAVIELAPGRTIDMQWKLGEWLEEEGKRWKVHRSGNDLLITAEFSAPHLDNGTLSAVASVMADLDRAFADLAKFRWLNRVKVTAKKADVDDTDNLPAEEEGEST